MSRSADLLQQLGLSNKEARLYLAALEYGPTSVIALSRQAGLKRGTIYEFLEAMVEKGIIEVVISGKRRLYKGTDPKHLNRLVERQKEIVSNLISDLALLVPASAAKPKIRFFEGKQGILTIYEELLTLPPGSEVVGYASFAGVYKLYSESAIKDYIRRRAVARIKQKLIMPTDEYMENHVSNNQEELRETVMVPQDKFNISNEINIYEDKVAIISLGEEKIGVIIESPQIAATQKAIFNLLWESLTSKKYD